MNKQFLLLTIFFLSAPVFAFTSWEDSPYNWNNSESNWENSSNNYKNSPNNWVNSRNNPNANLIYDNNGNPQGYAVPKSDGSGVNIYDFDGNRTNYYNY